jgi:autotransporter passenger strand-loop-strand repeat protein
VSVEASRWCGGLLEVLSGDFSSDTIEGGGSVVISFGGLAVAANILSGGGLTVRTGSSSSGMVFESDGSDEVLSGGIESSTIISGGALEIVPGGDTGAPDKSARDADRSYIALGEPLLRDMRLVKRLPY